MTKYHEFSKLVSAVVFDAVGVSTTTLLQNLKSLGVADPFKGNPIDGVDDISTV